MANAVLWSASSNVATGISNANMTAGSNLLGAAFNNAASKHRFIDLELQFTFASAPTQNKTFTCWILYALDGTNYEDGSNTVNSTLKGASAQFPMRGASGAQRVTIPHVAIRPYNLKFLLFNESSNNATGIYLTAKASNEELQ